MANQLKMAKIDAILSLHQRKWSIRRIANELGIHRDTVARHVHLAEQQAKPARAPTGSEATGDVLEDPKPATPEGGAQSAKPATPEGGAQSAKPARAPIGSPGGRRQQSQPLRTVAAGHSRQAGAGPVGPAHLAGPGRGARLLREVSQRPPLRSWFGPGPSAALPAHGVRPRRRGPG